MSLDKKVEELKRLLSEFPEMKDSKEFDSELQKRRKIFNEIKTETDKLYNEVEKKWAVPAWISVKEKIVIIDGSTRNNNDKDSQFIDWYTCPRCGFGYIKKESRYCSGCGAKIVRM